MNILSNNLLFWSHSLLPEVCDYNLECLNKNQITHIIYCKNGSCELNPNSSRIICKACVTNTMKYIASCEQVKIGIKINIKKTKSEKCFNCYDKVIDNYFLSIYRERNILHYTKKKLYFDNINRHLHYLGLKIDTEIMNIDPSSIYVFNSRFPTSFMISLFAKRKGIKTITYDLLALNVLHYSTNSTVLCPENLARKVREFSKGKLFEEIVYHGKKYIKNKKEKKYIAYRIFNKNQISNKIFENVTYPYIAFFTSSVDEMDYFGDELLFPKIDQIDFINKFSSLIYKKGVCVVVRIHPNQSKSSFEKCCKELEKNNRNIVLINGNSYSDTYKIMNDSMANISFGSSTGIESILMKKRSILIGRSIYDKSIQIENYLTPQILYSKIFKKNSVSDIQFIEACEWVYYLSSNDNKFSKETIINYNLLEKITFFTARVLRFISHPKYYCFKKFNEYINTK